MADNFGIAPRIYAMHEQRRAANDRLRGPRDASSPFYASEAGGCGRRITYSTLGFPAQPFAGLTLRIFAMGDLVESNVIGELRSAGFTVRNCEQDCDRACAHGQKRARLRWPFVSGKADGVISGTVKGAEVTRLLELKSMNTRGFAILQAQGVEKSNPGYYAQIQLYLLALDLPEATIIVEDKDKQQLYEETLLFDPVYVADLCIRLQTTRRYMDAGKLAPPDYPKSSFACRFCPYSEHCPGLPEPVRQSRARVTERS